MNRLLEHRDHSPFGTGLFLTLANKRLLLWAWLASLAVGLRAALPFHARISPILDHSLAAQSLAGRLDVSAYGTLMMGLGKHGTSLYAQAFEAILAYGVVANILAAGIYYVFGTGELPRLAVVVRSGIEYFWRFFRLMIFTIIICGPILAILFFLRSLLLKHADHTVVGRPYFFISLATFIVLLLVALFLRLWFDIAEASLIQLGQENIRRVRGTVVPSLRLLCRRFGPAYFEYLLIGIFGVAGLVLFVWLWVAAVPPHAVFLAWILGQLGVLCLLAARIWQRGLATAIVAAAQPPASVWPPQRLITAAEPAPVAYVPPASTVPAGPGTDAPASNPSSGEGTRPDTDVSPSPS